MLLCEDEACNILYQFLELLSHQQQEDRVFAAHCERPQTAWVSRNVRAIYTNDREYFLHVFVYALDQVRFKPRVVRLSNEDTVFFQCFVDALVEALRK